MIRLYLVASTCVSKAADNEVIKALEAQIEFKEAEIRLKEKQLIIDKRL